MSIIYTETKSNTDSRTDIDIGDGRTMTITITGEGIIMDVYGCKADIHQPHLGTVGMTFDEWADDVVLVYEGRSPSSTLMKESRLA